MLSIDPITLPEPTRGRMVLVAVAVVAALVAATQLPGMAQTAGDDPLPSVVFIARADNPVDALAASSAAGALGGSVLLTRSSTLEDSTRQALVDLGPDLVVLAGGTGALSPAVEAQIEAIPLETRRIAGASRVETAAELANLAADLGYGRPLLTGATVGGDAGLAGTMSVDAIAVDSNALVDNLNAALLDGRTAQELVPQTFEFTISAADWGNNLHYGSGNVYRRYDIPDEVVGGINVAAFFASGGSFVAYVDANHEGGGSLGGWHSLPYLYRSADGIGVKVVLMASRGAIGITETTVGWNNTSIADSELPDELDIRLVFLETAGG